MLIACLLCAFIVTLHVSVWVEIALNYISSQNIQSRSTWACELKCNSLQFCYLIQASRSTWACELKCLCGVVMWFSACHAPRERVSWNIIYNAHKPLATSHAPRERVSWNRQLRQRGGNREVTLHVSVWVEIISKTFLSICFESRSTWACELKCRECSHDKQLQASRSTWACELKFRRYNIWQDTLSHAPRERVSWNEVGIVTPPLIFGHAPRERVSWNIYKIWEHFSRCGHAPRERVSWNTGLFYVLMLIACVTLHVSVWVEMLVAL